MGMANLILLRWRGFWSWHRRIWGLLKIYILSKPLIYTPVNDTDAWFQNNEKCYMSNPHSIGDILMPYSWYFCTRNVFHSLQVYINYTRNKSTRKRVFIFNVPLRGIWIYAFGISRYLEMYSLYIDSLGRIILYCM